MSVDIFPNFFISLSLADVCCLLHSHCKTMDDDDDDDDDDNDDDDNDDEDNDDDDKDDGDEVDCSTHLIFIFIDFVEIRPLSFSTNTN